MNSNAISLILFPEITDVFGKNIDENQAVFFPLASIYLPNKELNTWFHLIQPWGVPGNEDNFFDEEYGRYALRFKLKNNKYDFLGDYYQFPQFEKLKTWYQEALDKFNSEEQLDFEEIPSYSLSDLDQHDQYLHILISYLSKKKSIKEKMNHPSLLRSYLNSFGFSQDPIYSLGGPSNSDEIELFQSPRFIFISQFDTFGVDEAYLLYDKDQQEILEIFHWS